jgi:type I restriction enzyme S subunit
MQPVISNTGLKNINIIITPPALQQEFADKIEAIEKQKQLIKESIAETEELFNSRMDYYFN